MAQDSVPVGQTETQAQRPEAGSKFKDVYLPAGMVITLVGLFIAGGIAWGDAQAQIKTMTQRVAELEASRRAIEEVKVQQASIKAELEGVRREQGIYVGNLGSKVDKLDAKLDTLLQRLPTKR